MTCTWTHPPRLPLQGGQARAGRNRTGAYVAPARRPEALRSQDRPGSIERADEVEECDRAVKFLDLRDVVKRVAGVGINARVVHLEKVGQSRRLRWQVRARQAQPRQRQSHGVGGGYRAASERLAGLFGALPPYL